jgi:phospholipid/cholesterol/gamma-HCH transport system ATP-binding protein
MSRPEPLLECRDLYRSFGELEVLIGTDFIVKRGETVVVMGRSGCGKSVLLKHLNGLYRPDRGSVFFDGEEISGKSERELVSVRRRIGMLFQAGALFDSLTVGENVAFPLERYGLYPGDARADRIAELLSFVSMEGTEDRMPSELSGGMRKRAALARTLALEPDLLLYDEPTTGLDPVTGHQVNRLLRDLQARLGLSAVVVTHDVNTARYVADKIAFLYDGRIREIGTVEGVFASTDPVISEFLYPDSARPGPR